MAIKSKQMKNINFSLDFGVIQGRGGASHIFSSTLLVEPLPDSRPVCLIHGAVSMAELKVRNSFCLYCMSFIDTLSNGASSVFHCLFIETIFFLAVSNDRKKTSAWPFLLDNQSCVSITDQWVNLRKSLELQELVHRFFRFGNLLYAAVQLRFYIQTRNKLTTVDDVTACVIWPAS